MCDKGFIENPSNCECECDKACDVGEYFDYENCKCRKKLVAPLIEECAETFEEMKLAKITLAENENSYKFNSCTVYIVLMIVIFTICKGISAYFVYYNWSLVKNNVSRIKFGTRTQTTGFQLAICDSRIVLNFSRITFFEKLRKSRIKAKTNFKRKN